MIRTPVWISRGIRPDTGFTAQHESDRTDFVVVRLPTKATKDPGSRTAALKVVSTLIDAAQAQLTRRQTPRTWSPRPVLGPLSL